MSVEPIRCPHCTNGVGVKFDEMKADNRLRAVHDKGGVRHKVEYGYCQIPDCQRLIIRLQTYKSRGPYNETNSTEYVLPRTTSRIRFSDVPPSMAEDYEQAGAVLDISPGASAALARRCLQRVLREEFKVKKGRLYHEIKRAVEKVPMPPHLAGSLERIREIGNLAAHPKIDSEMGVIVGVSREEAGWTLEILEALFKYCYVDPKEHEERTRSLREKLDGAKGKKGKKDTRRAASAARGKARVAPV